MKKLRKNLDYIARCYRCSGIYVLPEDGSYICPYCRFYDGNATSEIVYDPWEAEESRQREIYTKVKK